MFIVLHTGDPILAPMTPSFEMHYTAAFMDEC